VTKHQWQIVNALASQLQHFYDRDGKQYADQELADLLNQTEEMLNQTRPRGKTLCEIFQAEEDQ